MDDSLFIVEAPTYRGKAGSEGALKSSVRTRRLSVFRKFCVQFDDFDKLSFIRSLCHPKRPWGTFRSIYSDEPDTFPAREMRGHRSPEDDFLKG